MISKLLHNPITIRDLTDMLAEMDTNTGISHTFKRYPDGKVKIIAEIEA